MITTLNNDLLSGMIKEKRGSRGLREVSKEIGNVSPSTLSRIENGKVPDVDTFIKICKWLKKSTETFVINHTIEQKASSKEQIVAHLRAEKELEPKTVKMLVQMIELAYNQK